MVEVMGGECFPWRWLGWKMVGQRGVKSHKLVAPDFAFAPAPAQCGTAGRAHRKARFGTRPILGVSCFEGRGVCLIKEPNDPPRRRFRQL